MPEFVIGLWLIVIFATTVFPGTLPSITQIPPGGRPWDDMTAMILPTATLVLTVTPYVARIVRASMIEVLESDYVEMARLKGLSERTVMIRHALPNALGPAFQVIAINLAYLAGGVHRGRGTSSTTPASAARWSTPSTTTTSPSCRRWRC